MDYIYLIGMLIAALIFGYIVNAFVDKKINQQENNDDTEQATANHSE